MTRSRVDRREAMHLAATHRLRFLAAWICAASIASAGAILEAAVWLISRSEASLLLKSLAVAAAVVLVLVLLRVLLHVRGVFKTEIENATDLESRPLLDKRLTLFLEEEGQRTRPPDPPAESRDTGGNPPPDKPELTDGSHRVLESGPLLLAAANYWLTKHHFRQLVFPVGALLVAEFVLLAFLLLPSLQPAHPVVMGMPSPHGGSPTAIQTGTPSPQVSTEGPKSTTSPPTQGKSNLGSLVDAVAAPIASGVVDIVEHQLFGQATKTASEIRSFFLDKVAGPFVESFSKGIGEALAEKVSVLFHLRPGPSQAGNAPPSQTRQELQKALTEQLTQQFSNPPISTQIAAAGIAPEALAKTMAERVAGALSPKLAEALGRFPLQIVVLSPDQIDALRESVEERIEQQVIPVILPTSTPPGPTPGPTTPGPTTPSPPSPPPPRPPPPTPPPHLIYIVKPRDSLWTISHQFLGAHATTAEIASAWPQLFALNRRTIGQDPNLIRPGEALRIPTSVAAKTS